MNNQPINQQSKQYKIDASIRGETVIKKKQEDWLTTIRSYAVYCIVSIYTKPDGGGMEKVIGNKHRKSKS